MSRKLYQDFEANEWVQPVREGFRSACCDCGLVHEMDFRIYKGRVQFRVRRNNRSTAALRRSIIRAPVGREET
jgi:hypothetical protein